MNWKHIGNITETELPYHSRGWLAIDSMGDGSATGGVRFGENVRPDEIRELAEEMTLKFSFLNLPIGGAKAGICCPNPVTPDQKKEIFLGFGKALSQLLTDKAYLPGTDMGTMPTDIRHLRQGAGLESEKDHKDINSGYYTAISVFSALKAAVSASGLEMNGLRISVQGLGKVGIELIRLTARHGLKLVAAATRKGALSLPQGLDTDMLISLATQYGDDAIYHYKGVNPIAAEDIMTSDTDILCPCAGSHPIHAGNVDQIRAKIIIPGCNVAASSETEDRLFERNILYLPGFVCNSGGVLCYLLSAYGFAETELADFLAQGIGQKVKLLLDLAKSLGISPASTARQTVERYQQRFVRESRAIGKLQQAIVRFKSCGIRETIYTLVWAVVRRDLHRQGLKQHLARKILSDRLFGIADRMINFEFFQSRIRSDS
ncbi:MAG: Glu/Leu/Phe/Val dehydrogenase [Desulfobacteraceae bacterium]|nr:Glu/Leu/Phe/Val dehydrogenase [Desulfobacteraceae bacterium]